MFDSNYINIASLYSKQYIFVLLKKKNFQYNSFKTMLHRIKKLKASQNEFKFQKWNLFRSSVPLKVYISTLSQNWCLLHRDWLLITTSCAKWKKLYFAKKKNCKLLTTLRSDFSLINANIEQNVWMLVFILHTFADRSSLDTIVTIILLLLSTYIVFKQMRIRNEMLLGMRERFFANLSSYYILPYRASQKFAYHFWCQMLFHFLRYYIWNVMWNHFQTKVIGLVASLFRGWMGTFNDFLDNLVKVTITNLSQKTLRFLMIIAWKGGCSLSIPKI